MGKFIVFEGVDGSGTTTQIKRAAAWLRERGIDVVETAEPTGGAVGKTIRQALSRQMPGHEGCEIAPELFALLFAADRLDHMTATVEPALKAGRWVLSDRSYLSSFVYQSIDGDLDWVRSLNRHARRADLTLLLDLDAATAYERLAHTRDNHEVFETTERMTVIRDTYLKIAGLLQSEGERIDVIDAARPIEEVAGRVREALTEIV